MNKLMQYLINIVRTKIDMEKQHVNLILTCYRCVGLSTFWPWGNCRSSHDSLNWVKHSEKLAKHGGTVCWYWPQGQKMESPTVEILAPEMHSISGVGKTLWMHNMVTNLWDRVLFPDLLSCSAYCIKTFPSIFILCMLCYLYSLWITALCGYQFVI